MYMQPDSFAVNFQSTSCTKQNEPYTSRDFEALWFQNRVP